MKWTAKSFAAVVLGMALVTQTLAVDTDALGRKRQSQERARAMARELITGILDIQIRQLEENGLRELPIYGEIRTMRDNIDVVAKDKMESVVKALLHAQDATDSKQRLERFNTARDEIRSVVRDLMAERQKLLRRLQIARVSAQVRELIRREEKILTATQRITNLPQIEAERATLVAHQDQRDMKVLFLELIETMVNMKEWGGHLAAAAGDGLRILQVAQVGEEVDNAEQALASGKYDFEADVLWG